jgi:hypothetical protein
MLIPSCDRSAWADVLGGCFDPSGSSTKCAALTAVELFDPSSSTWSTAHPLTTPRHGFGLAVCATSEEPMMVAIGGSSEPGIMNNPTPLATTEFAPIRRGVLDVWTAGANLSTAR